MREPFHTLTSHVVCLAVDHVDTDQIVPARFLKTTSREGLGAALLADWRYEADGRPRPDFPLNRPEAQGSSVLLAGENFGCGSSREHAVWALLDHGFRAVVARSFADIFRANAIENGLLPVELVASAWNRLLGELQERPLQEVRIDLEDGRLEVAAPQPWTARFAIEPFARHCLLHGVDAIDYLLSRRDEIARFESLRTPPVDTRTGPGRAVIAPRGDKV